MWQLDAMTCDKTDGEMEGGEKSNAWQQKW